MKGKENGMKKKNRDELIMQELLEGYIEDVNEVPSEDAFISNAL